jgi:hypothetical protein
MKKSNMKKRQKKSNRLEPPAHTIIDHKINFYKNNEKIYDNSENAEVINLGMEERAKVK